MRQSAASFFEFLDQPIRVWARVLLALLVVPLALSFTVPLWNIYMKAPQYPEGLSLDIYLHKLEGGNDGHDITEINTLNHYIGMAKIERSQLKDLDWLPFAMGLLAIVALRCAAIGNIRILVDLLVVSGYVSFFAFARFVYMLYAMGHDLDPHAPVHIKPFTPVILGTNQVANFTITSMPRGASILIGVFVVGVALITAVHLYVGWRDSRRMRAAG